MRRCFRLISVPGIWNAWEPWTPCTKTCGQGQSSRSRTCDDTAYGDLTEPCIGESDERKICNNFDCEPYREW